MNKGNFWTLAAGLTMIAGSVAHADAVKKAALPLAVYADGSKATFIPSGYRGNTGAIKMNPSYTVQSHSGKTCLQAQSTATGNWGASSGGCNLAGAKTLSF